MRRVDFHIPIYDWDITIVTLYDSGCKQDLGKLIDEFNLPLKEELFELLDSKSYDGGRTFSRKKSREEVVILFPWRSEEAFQNVLNHEKRHVIDDIVEWHDLKSPEAAAYLDGYVSKEIYKRLEELR